MTVWAEGCSASLLDISGTLAAAPEEAVAVGEDFGDLLPEAGSLAGGDVIELLGKIQEVRAK
jgi:hypothetical protein